MESGVAAVMGGSALKISTAWGPAELLRAPDGGLRAIGSVLRAASCHAEILQIRLRPRTGEETGIVPTTSRHGMTGGRAGAEFLDYGVLRIGLVQTPRHNVIPSIKLLCGLKWCAATQPARQPEQIRRRAPYLR